MQARDRLIVALDVPTGEDALGLADRLAGHVGMLKVGSQLFTAAGPELVRALAARQQRVFLDLKFHDIPNTVAGAVESACRLGVRLLTMHAAGGAAMMQAAARARGDASTRLLAITVLTSHDAGTLAEIGLAGPLPEAVRRLARLAQASGLDGVVCSPEEAALVREACGRGFLIVTPGIRPSGAAAGDQARATTPSAALSAGADHLVVGRPVIAAPDPAAAAEAIVREMESVRRP
ncbi:MAG TPA: orotidine-5'-phosphate decarboxylase [Vicinamibacteria bacterium]|nr:orotidine-5'-phosphate decarboxylase [Vicinamibacteria bacterium]